MKYSPKTTPKYCDTCMHIKGCTGCHDGIEYESKNQQELIDYVHEQVEKGHTISALELYKMYGNNR